MEGLGGRHGESSGSRSASEVTVGGSVLSWQQPLPTGSSEVRGDFVLEVDGTPDAAELREIAETLLANPVIEDVELHLTAD